MGAAFGLGFVLGPAIGGLLGTYGPRVPFFVAAAISGLNLLFGYFVLPETLPQNRRRRFAWRRANPFGTFKVFQSYTGILPLCAVLAIFFFASSVYPAIWPFWGMAKFGWDTAIVGLTLAAFGLIAALTQGFLSGPLAARFGEHRVVLFGLISATIAAAGYALAPGLAMVLIMLVIHAPEGLVHPMLVAIMSKSVPDDAQGELQGGIAGVMSLAMLAGTVFFSQVFGRFMRPDAVIVSPVIGYWVAAAVLACTLALFWVIERRRIPVLVTP
jgi:DHA1 family tetracycline resistance protein-like MFS transporter